MPNDKRVNNKDVEQVKTWRWGHKPTKSEYWALFFIGTSLLPAAEEFLFRLLLFDKLLLHSLHGPFKQTLVVQAVVYSLVHIASFIKYTPKRALLLFLLGIEYGLIYQHFGYWWAVGAHAAVNLLAVLALGLLAGYIFESF